MNDVSLFEQFTKVVENKPLSEIIKSIQNGTYKENVEPLRTALQANQQDLYNKHKKSLLAFTPSGKYAGGRTADCLVAYSHYLVLDIDHITTEQVKELRDQAAEIPFTIAAFASPSNEGLKIIVGVDTDVEEHTLAYKQVSAHYSSELNIEFDPKNKDVTRLCFVSYDPQAYFNQDYENFKVVEEQAKLIQPKMEVVVGDYSVTFKECVQFTEQKEQYVEGNRNNFIYLLASNCNRKGIPQEEAQEMILQHFDLSHQEIEASVKSAYNHHAQEFGAFAKAKPTTQQEVIDEEDYLKNSPIIPPGIYDTLPNILKEGASGFTDVRERDVFLTGALCILSGCLPNVSGLYDQRIYYPNLFGFIIAPAASGKGALNSAKNLADLIHDNMREISDANRKEYERELQEYKTALKARKKDDQEELEEPKEPNFNVLYIPANTSNAKVLWHLQQNDGKGIICETEADTMGNVFKQEWGGYSDMLRKAFHHEKISCSRKTNNEYIEVKQPQLSVALSGTPNQVSNLIQSAEDGLFSRFIFYSFKTEQKWRDVSPFGGGVNLTALFDKLGKDVFEMFGFLNASPTNVQLSKDKWQKLNITFAKRLTDVSIFTSDEAGSVVKRLGLMFFRICMLYTALRKFENGDLDPQPYCTDEDFENALVLANIYLEHSLLMYHNLPKQDDAQAFKGSTNKQKFYEHLPNKFKRAEAVDLGSRYKMSPRTVDNLLKKLQPDYLISEEYGVYTKIK